MSCYYSRRHTQDVKDAIGQIKRDVSAMERSNQSAFNKIASVLERLENRLDVLEQAAADPDGEAIESLRKKHGLGKQGPVRPLGNLGKKAGA